MFDSGTYPRSTAQWEMAAALFHTHRPDKVSQPRSTKALKDKWRQLRDPPKRSGQTEFTETEQQAINLHKEADEMAGVSSFGRAEDDDEYVDGADDTGDDSDLPPTQVVDSPVIVLDADASREIEASQLSADQSDEKQPLGQVPRTNRNTAPPSSSLLQSSSSSSPASTPKGKAYPQVNILNNPTFQKKTHAQKKEDDTSALIQYLILRDDERRREDKEAAEERRREDKEAAEERRREEKAEREAKEELLREELREERRAREAREDRTHVLLMALLGRGRGIAIEDENSAEASTRITRSSQFSSQY